MSVRLAAIPAERELSFGVYIIKSLVQLCIVFWVLYDYQCDFARAPHIRVRVPILWVRVLHKRGGGGESFFCDCQGPWEGFKMLYGKTCCRFLMNCQAYIYIYM